MGLGRLKRLWAGERGPARGPRRAADLLSSPGSTFPGSTLSSHRSLPHPSPTINSHKPSVAHLASASAVPSASHAFPTQPLLTDFLLTHSSSLHSVSLPPGSSPSMGHFLPRLRCPVPITASTPCISTLQSFTCVVINYLRTVKTASPA